MTSSSLIAPAASYVSYVSQLQFISWFHATANRWENSTTSMQDIQWIAVAENMDASGIQYFHHPYAAGQFQTALQDLQTHESIIPTHNPAALHTNCITIPTLESLFRWPGEKLPTQHMLTRHLSREAEESLRQTLPDQEKERLDAIIITMVPIVNPNLI